MSTMAEEAEGVRSIRRALDEAKKVRLRQDSSILLIQSGALFPDGAMVTEVGKHFRVMPFSGVPPHPHDPAASNPETFARSLRLAAARARPLASRGAPTSRATC